MCPTLLLRELLHQTLAAAAEEILALVQRTIADYQAEASQSKHEAEQHRKLLDIILKPELKLHRLADPPLCGQQQHYENKSPPLGQVNLQLPQVKEEQDELWTGQGGEQLQGPEHAGSEDSLFTISCVRSLYNQDDAKSVHLNQTQSLENSEQDAQRSTLTKHLETEAKGCGISEPTSDHQTLIGSVAEREDRDNDEERGGPHSGLNPLKPQRNQAAKEKHSGTKNRTDLDQKLAGQLAPRQCKICGKSFKVKGNLINHSQNHVKDSPYCCGVCGGFEKSKDSLVLHLETHKKTYVCCTCGKSFTSTGNLRRHVRTHRREKPYHCHVCDRRFRKRVNCKSHMATHTGKTPHSRRVCGKEAGDSPHGETLQLRRLRKVQPNNETSYKYSHWGGIV